MKTTTSTGGSIASIAVAMIDGAMRARSSLGLQHPLMPMTMV